MVVELKKKRKKQCTKERGGKKLPRNTQTAFDHF